MVGPVASGVAQAGDGAPSHGRTEAGLGRVDAMRTPDEGGAG